MTGSGPVTAGSLKKLNKAYIRKKLSEFVFLGRHISQKEDFSISMDQHEYVKKIESIYIPAARRKDPESKATGE